MYRQAGTSPYSLSAEVHTVHISVSRRFSDGEEPIFRWLRLLNAGLLLAKTQLSYKQNYLNLTF